MKQNRQPVYLFADSQLLFWKERGVLFLGSVRRLVTGDAPKAAYVGASNGDAPEFYSIFEAAVRGAGILDCRMIRRSFPAEDRTFLCEADIILLAGGEVERGWHVFAETGMGEHIVRRFEEGAVLLGISAGAVQLGLYEPVESESSHAELKGTFGLVPFVLDAHDEARQWGRLRKTIRLLGGAAEGVGIPTGGGAVFYPDGRVEAVRHPLYQISSEGGEVREVSLPPSGRWLNEL